MNTIKKISIALVVALLPLLAGSLSSKKYTYVRKTSGAHPGSTGAPGDQTCSQAGCHKDATINNNVAGVNTLVYPVADSTYVPGQKYSIKLQVLKSGIQKFGFEICALDNALNESAGNLEITDANRTQLISHTVSGNSRESITHKTNGTPASPATGQTSWSFDWTAPATNVGKITFYYCVNCTNNNNANSGDMLYINSFTIKPKSSIGLEEWVDESSANLFYNRESKQFVFNFNMKKGNNVLLKVADITGKEIISLNQEKGKGQYNERLNAGQELAQGLYLLSLTVDGKSLIKKVLLNE